MKPCPHCKHGHEPRTSRIDVRVSSPELAHFEDVSKSAGYRTVSTWVRDVLISHTHAETDPFSLLFSIFSESEIELINHAASVHGKVPVDWARMILLWWSQEPACSRLSTPKESLDDSLSMILNGSPAPSKSDASESTTANVIDTIQALLTFLQQK